MSRLSFSDGGLYPTSFKVLFYKIKCRSGVNPDPTKDSLTSCFYLSLLVRADLYAFGVLKSVICEKKFY